jgi:hypothetical protein
MVAFRHYISSPTKRENMKIFAWILSGAAVALLLADSIAIWSLS